MPIVASVFIIVQMRKDVWPDLWIVLIASSRGARVEIGFSNSSSAVTRVPVLFRSSVSWSKPIFWASRSNESSFESIDIVLVCWTQATINRK